jgi:hypothetical protein
VVAGIDRTYRGFGIGRSSVRMLGYLLFEGRPLTTRGRWINPLVFALSGVLTKTVQLKKVSRPIFIVGTGRSGTTILGMTLSLHASVGFLNEPKALWHRAFPHEDIIGNYAMQPGRYVLTDKDATLDVVDKFHKLYGGFLKLGRRTRILDKYPEALFRITFLLRAFPDAKFIWLVRNGNDTIASIEKWSALHRSDTSGAREDWWGRDNRKWQALVEQVCSKDPLFADNIPAVLSLDRDVDKAAVEWTVSVQQGLREEARHPGRILRVRFENLSQEPEVSLRAILKYCELDDDPAVFAFAKSKLGPGKNYTVQALAPIIHTPFNEAMRSLGYVTNGSSIE